MIAGQTTMTPIHEVTSGSVGNETALDPRYGGQTYTIRRKVLTLIGAKFHVFDGQKKLILFSRLKGFRLKEDIRLYADESMGEELLWIKARNIIDFSATYDVVDSQTGRAVGSIRRKGLKSLIRDSWEILDVGGQVIGTIQEDSTALALIRRWVDMVAMFLPQGFTCAVDGQPIATFKQNYNPFVHRLAVDFSANRESRLDPRLGLASAILLLAIEGRQR